MNRDSRNRIRALLPCSIFKLLILAACLWMFVWARSAYATCPTSGNCNIEIAPGGDTFQYKDGTRFFWMGDTSWLLGTNELTCDTPGSNPCAYPSHFYEYFFDRQAQGFTVVQGLMFVASTDDQNQYNGATNEAPFCKKVSGACGTGAYCRKPAINSPADWDYDCPNDTYFANVKTRIQELNNDLHMIVAIAPSWGAAFRCTTDTWTAYPWDDWNQIKNFYDYLADAQRFGDSNLKIVWLLGGNVREGTGNDDFTCCFGKTGTVCNAPTKTWDDLKTEIRNQGDTEHLITLHPAGLSTDLGTFDFVQMQHQPCADPGWTTTYKGYTPIVNGEFAYETDPTCWIYQCDHNGTDCKQFDGGYGDDHYSCAPGDSNFNPCSCSEDPNCKPHHHSRPEVGLHGAWSTVMRGGYFDWGFVGTYLNYADTYYTTTNTNGANYMKHLYNFFNNNSEPVNWDKQDFQPIFGNSVKANGTSMPVKDYASPEDDKLAMGWPGVQYVLYARTGADFTIGNESGVWKWQSLSTITGVTTDEGTVSADASSTIHINSVPSDSANLLTHIEQGIFCDPLTLVDANTQYSANCTITGTANATFDLSCTEPSSSFTCSFPPQVQTGNDGTGHFSLTASYTGSPAAGSYVFGLLATNHNNPNDIIPGSALVQVAGNQCESFYDWPADGSGENWYFTKDVWSAIDTDSPPDQHTDALLSQGEATRKASAVPNPNTNTILTPCTECSIEADVQVNGNPLKVSLLGWYTPYNTGKSRVELMLKFKKDQYGHDKSKIVIKQWVNGIKGPKKATEAGIGLQTGVVYHLEMRYKFEGAGGHYYAHITGGTVDATLDVVANGSPAGVPGFRTRHSEAVFYNLTVHYGPDVECTAECSCGPAQPQPSGDEFSSDTSPSPVVYIHDKDTDEGTVGLQNARVKVTISPASSFPFTVDYATSDGSALAGQDYVAKSGTLSIAAGQTVKFIRIPIVADYDVEPPPDETFTVSLSNPTGGAAIGGSGQATVTIEDDDTPEDDDGPDDDFDVDCPTDFSVIKNDTRTLTCGLTLYDFLNPSTDISWSCMNNGNGSPQCQSFSSNGSDQLYAQVAAGNTVSDNNFTVTGAVLTDSHSDSLNLHVVDFQPTCPSTISVTRNHYTDSSCSVGSSSNWTDNTLQVTWSCPGLPTGVSCVFTPNPWTVSSGANVALRISAGSSAQGGDYNITVTGSSGSQARTSSVLLHVITQQTFTFYPVGDTYLTGYSQQNTNYGLATNLRIQQTSNYSHVILKVSQQDLLNAIGAYQILSANLKLYIETNFKNWPSGGATVDVHRMTGTWQEYIFLNPPLGATWNCATDANLNNSTPDCSPQWNGGSYSSAVLSSVLHNNNLTGWISFDVKSDVQAIQTGTMHYGWLVRKRNWSDAGSVDYTSLQGNPQGNTKPRLEVTVQY